MSESSPLKPTDTTISMLPARGMITVRGDLKSKKLIAGIVTLTDAVVPAPGQFSYRKKAAGCIWMSPDELLLSVDRKAVHASVETLQQALSGEHGLISNVSDARAIIQIKGPNTRDVLAKLTPANISAPVFQPGDVRRSRIAQVAAAFWMLDPETVELVCFRSSDDYVTGLLEQASRLGAEPGFH